MANQITPRDNGGTPNRPLDLFSAMRAEMDRVFERFHHGWPSLPGFTAFAERGAVMPSLDVKETDTAITVEAELPGVDEKDVTLTVKDGVLTIKGEKRESKEEKGENRHYVERSFGSFLRSIPLPDSVDDSKVEARFDRGVLTITAQKRPEALRAEKRIEIKKS